MAVSINRITRLITMPQADLSLVSGTQYELDVAALSDELFGIRATVEGAQQPSMQRFTTGATLEGIKYADSVELINLYRITFEDTGTPYQIRCINANHNFLSAHLVLTSGVSLDANLTGGLIEGGGGADVSGIWGDAADYPAGSKGDIVNRLNRLRTI